MKFGALTRIALGIYATENGLEQTIFPTASLITHYFGKFII